MIWIGNHPATLEDALMVATQGEDKTRPSLRPMVAIGFAMFSDAFYYGVAIPLTPHSPAGASSENSIGLLYGGYALGVLLLTPLCGILADRSGCKRPLLAGCLIQLLAILVCALAPNFWILMLSRVLQGGAAAATWTAGLAVVAKSYREDRVQKMGLSMVGMTAGSLAGPLAGGLLYDLSGYYTPLWMAAGVVLIDLTLRAALLPSDRGHVPVSNAIFVLLRSRAVLVSAVVVALIAGGWGVVEPHLPGHLAQKFGTSSAMIGLLFTAAGVAYGLVTGPVQRMSERRGLRDTISFGLFLMAVAMPLMILAHHLIWSAALLCLVSIAYAFAMNPTLADLADAVDRRAPGAYASVYVVFNIAYSIGMIGGDMIAEPLVSQFSLLVAYLALSVILLTAIPMLWWSYKAQAVPLASPT